MGRQSGDPTRVTSSIALLQERFRQLQRVKEKREERELLKLFSDSDQIAPTTRFESKFSFQPEMDQSPSHLQDSVSLGLNLQNKQSDHSAMTTPILTSSWPHTAVTAGSSKSIENLDVDTSLHL